jgi:hypothetical protein
VHSLASSVLPHRLRPPLRLAHAFRLITLVLLWRLKFLVRLKDFDGCFAHCLLFSVLDLVTAGVPGAFPLALPSKLHSMARTHPLLQVPGLVFVGFRCGVLAGGGGLAVVLHLAQV